jgi:hypothetical protein
MATFLLHIGDLVPRLTRLVDTTDAEGPSFSPPQPGRKRKAPRKPEILGGGENEEGMGLSA